MVIPDGLPPKQVGEVRLTSPSSEAFEAKLTRLDWRFFQAWQSKHKSPPRTSSRRSAQSNPKKSGHNSKIRPEFS